MKSEQIVRPCCKAPVAAARLYEGSVRFPHRKGCERA